MALCQVHDQCRCCLLSPWNSDVTSPCCCQLARRPQWMLQPGERVYRSRWQWLKPGACAQSGKETERGVKTELGSPREGEGEGEGEEKFRFAWPSAGGHDGNHREPNLAPRSAKRANKVLLQAHSSLPRLGYFLGRLALLSSTFGQGERLTIGCGSVWGPGHCNRNQAASWQPSLHVWWAIGTSDSLFPRV